MRKRKDNLNLSNNITMRPSNVASASSGGRNTTTTTIVVVGALGVFVFACLCKTLSAQPLFPFQNDDLEWCRTWLYMTVVDFYGSTLALSAIVAWSEDSSAAAIVWILLMNLMGSPFACAYVVYRAYKHKTLALASDPDLD